MKKDQDPEIPQEKPKEIGVVEAMMNSALEEAEEESYKIIIPDNEKLQEIARAYFIQGYLKGTVRIIQHEIADRFAEAISREKKHKENVKKLHVAHSGAKKPRNAKEKAGN